MYGNPQYPIDDLEGIIREVGVLRETTRWRMELSKYARTYFGKEYMDRKNEFIRYDNLYRRVMELYEKTKEVND